MKKRLVSIILVITLVLSINTTLSFAAEYEDPLGLCVVEQSESK